MRILHVLTGGNIGGIETLCKEYARCSCHRNIMLLLWGDGPLADEMENEGVEVINMHASSKRIISTIIRFIQLCKYKEIDVVIIHHAAPISHMCLIAVKKVIPSIITIGYAHGNAHVMCRDKDKKGLWLRRKILSLSLKKADKVIAISVSVKNSLVSYFYTPEKNISVIYNGVNTEAFLPLKKNNHSEPQLIYVGRLIEEKGVQNILFALSKLEPSIAYHMRIVGDGPYRNKLEKISRDYSLQNKVEFCGSRRDVPLLLQESDIFVHMPDIEEGFGITVIEAMATGMVCIVADSGGMPEIITDEINGYLVEKGNVQLLSLKISKVVALINSYEIQKIQANAVRRAEDFSIRKFARQLDDIVLFH